MAKLAIKLVKSPIRCQSKHRETVKSLGLRKMNQTVVHDDSPAIRGMINKVSYLLDVQETV